MMKISINANITGCNVWMDAFQTRAQTDRQYADPHHDDQRHQKLDLKKINRLSDGFGLVGQGLY